MRKFLGVWPLFANARGHQIPWRIVRSDFKSAVLTTHNLGRAPFSDGAGYVRDPEHGGMDVSTPETMVPQLAGFEILEVVDGHSPHAQSRYLTPWYYYACRKQAASSG